MNIISKNLSDFHLGGHENHHLCDANAYNPRMVRDNYSRSVRNATPDYVVPETHRKRLPFIKDLVTKSQSLDVTASDAALYSRFTGERTKRFYRDRANAINALHAVFSDHVNLVTHQVEISLRNASDAAGLSTISSNEIKKAEKDADYVKQVSISRASRAFQDMIKMGWIVAPKAWQVWDKERNHWIDKYYEVTELFFYAVGITAERVERQRTNRLKYLKQQCRDQGMTEASIGRISITQIKAENKLAWRRKAFDRRRVECDRKKTKRQLSGKTQSEQRTLAALNVLNQLGDDARNLDYAQTAILINKEVARLRRVAASSPPTH